MAEKPKKKPRHTKLVLPGEGTPPARGKTTDRMGRVTTPGPESPAGQGTAAPAATQNPSGTPAAPSAPGAAAPLSSGQAPPLPPATGQEPAPAPPPLPENAVMMPRVNPRLAVVRRKKRKRRVISLVALLLAAVCLWLYFSGLYLHGVMAAQDFGDSLRIRMTPGGGWPAAYSITGYLASESLGGGGFASLGDKDLAIFSSSGQELRRLQHGFASPGLAAGNTRVCVYGRGGTGYTVESRSSTLLRRTSEQDILFAFMSPGGSLGLVTSSRYRSGIEIYNPLYPTQPDFAWSMVDEKPVTGVFSSDNRNFALACLSSKNGALGTTVYLLRTDKNEPLATLRADNARILRLEYLGQNRLLAVYDSYAALYNMKGEETARFDYAGRNLLAADFGAGRLALAFGSDARDSFDLCLLSDKLQPLFEQTAAGTGRPRVLAAQNGVFLLAGQEVAAFTLEGALSEIRAFEAKPLDLVQAGEPLLLTVSSAEALGGMIQTGAAAASSASVASQSTAPSASAAEPPQSSLPPGSSSLPAPPQQPTPEGAAPQP